MSRTYLSWRTSANLLRQLKSKSGSVLIRAPIYLLDPNVKIAYIYEVETDI